MTEGLPEGAAADAAVLDRVIALVNDKGGVGKTTLAANVAGQLAAAGYRVLAIDINRQGNLGDDLGYRNRAGVDDQGAGLLAAITLGTPLVPVADTRSNLWVIPGGIKLTDLTPLMLSRFQTHGRPAFLALAQSLAPVADQFDLIIIDSPPENVVLADLVLATARWVIMPTRSDTGGLIGMSLVAERFALAREINPDLGLLGVVLFGSLSNATAIHKEVRADVEAAFGFDPTLHAMIRHSESVARASRKTGQLAHELEVAAAAQPAWWQALRNGDKPGRRLPASADKVSADFSKVAGEILDALAAQEQPA